MGVSVWTDMSGEIFPAVRVTQSRYQDSSTILGCHEVCMPTLIDRLGLSVNESNASLLPGPLSSPDLRTLTPLAMDLLLKQIKQLLGSVALGLVPTIR